MEQEGLFLFKFGNTGQAKLAAIAKIEPDQFRVRLADLSGGGPDSDRDPVHPADAPIATCSFRRFVPPRKYV